jgi:hypothetical protein
LQRSIKFYSDFNVLSLLRIKNQRSKNGKRNTTRKWPSSLGNMITVEFAAEAEEEVKIG